MQSVEERLKVLEEQEETLQFTEFSNATALKIANSILEKAEKNSFKIALDITKNGQQVFHYAFDGTSPDNDAWLLMKKRIVDRFFHSSLYIGTCLEKFGRSLEDVWKLSTFEYAPSGGCFPIIVKNVGIIGTIAVSGLKDTEDHQLVVDAIREYLGL